MWIISLAGGAAVVFWTGAGTWIIFLAGGAAVIFWTGAGTIVVLEGGAAVVLCMGEEIVVFSTGVLCGWAGAT